MSRPIAATRTNPSQGSVHPVTVKTRFVKSVDQSGWLRVKLEPTGKDGYLCEFTKVAISKEESRVHFLIMEGTYKGSTASLSKENADACLVNAKRGAGAKLVVKVGTRQWVRSKPRNNEEHNQLMSTLFFDGQSASITLDSEIPYEERNRLSPNFGTMQRSKPLPKGVYKILAPTEPHKAAYTEFYVTASGGNPDLKYHTVWFTVENKDTHNSNFVHLGNLSEGCVTVYDLTKWNAVYRYLISNRSDAEGKYVGTVTIE